jgi:hypothetical protein
MADILNVWFSHGRCLVPPVILHSSLKVSQGLIFLGLLTGYELELVFLFLRANYSLVRFFSKIIHI